MKDIGTLWQTNIHWQHTMMTVCYNLALWKVLASTTTNNEKDKIQNSSAVAGSSSSSSAASAQNKDVIQMLDPHISINHAPGKLRVISYEACYISSQESLSSNWR